MSDIQHLKGLKFLINVSEYIQPLTITYSIGVAPITQITKIEKCVMKIVYIFKELSPNVELLFSHTKRDSS